MPSYTFTQMDPDKVATISGPHVWPTLVGEETVDRFIFRRPELAYWEAKRRMLERRTGEGKEGGPPRILVKVNQLYLAPKKPKDRPTYKVAIYQSLWIAPNWKDEVEDARAFLLSLRTVLSRYMSKTPMPNCVMRLRFFDPEISNDVEVLKWQERWL